MAKVLALSGSLRTGSYNTRLLDVAARVLEQKGATVARFDFRTNPLPIFDADSEQGGYGPGVIALKRAVREADAVLVSGPEYNAGPTPLLKNAIDWVSRKHNGENNEWEDKVCGLMSASPSAFGGVRAQVVYRNALIHCHAVVLAEVVTVPNAADAFDAEGNLLNERAKGSIERLATKLLEVSSRLRGI